MLDFLKRKPIPSIVPEPAAVSPTFAPIEPQEPVAHGMAPLRSSIRTASGSRPAAPAARMEPEAEVAPQAEPAPAFASIEPLEPVAHQHAPMRPVVRKITVESAPEMKVEPVGTPPVPDKYRAEVHLVSRQAEAGSSRSDSKPRVTNLYETEPHHRAGRLDRVREEIRASRPQLTPSQRAQQARPGTTHDRYGRPTYVTYTVKSTSSREHAVQE